MKPEIELPPLPRPQVPIISSDIDMMDIRRLVKWCEAVARTYALDVVEPYAKRIAELEALVEVDRQRRGGYLTGLMEADGCFRAAYAEGLSEALAETSDMRLKDLVERRILFAHQAIVNGISQPAEPVDTCPTNVCVAARADGVLCANDECDRESRVRPAEPAKALSDAQPLLDMIDTLCTGLEWNIEHYPEVMTAADDEALADARALLARYGAQPAITLPSRRNTPMRADEGIAPLAFDSGWNACLDAVQALGAQPAASAEPVGIVRWRNATPFVDWNGRPPEDGVAVYTAPVATQQPVSGDAWLPEGVAQFTKKPVTISAIRWTGSNLKEVIAFTGMHPHWHEWFSCWDEYVEHVGMSGGIFKIFTLEGVMEASPGDWIIRGVKGEHYPCRPDIFAATYEPADYPHIQQPYTLAEIEAKLACGDYGAEHLLQHAMLLLRNLTLGSRPRGNG